MPILICPICKHQLSVSEDKNYKCTAGHNYDIAKEGYVNLLPVQNKKSKLPGDNNLMINARRAFLEKDIYRPLVDKLIAIIQNLVAEEHGIVSLDAGCGEGYYTANVLNKLNDIKYETYGFDISKYAVRKASQKYKDILFFVSSVYNIPIAESQIDLILSIFSPISPDEFARILSKTGYVIIVSPGENHMKELAKIIYGDFRIHKNNVPDKMSRHFANVDSYKVKFQTLINDSETLIDLLKMTPYYWNTNEENQSLIRSTKNLELTFDFHIMIFKS